MRRLALLLALLAGPVHASDPASPFGRALQVESSAVGGAHRGEIRAVLEQPYGMAAPALASASAWCEILTLQVNIKRCEASGSALAAFITRKARDPVSDAHRIDFRFEAVPQDGRLRVALTAPSGPVGTRDYEIRVQVAPLDAKRTRLDMVYAYRLGTMARFAMDAYLAGPGRDKRGFSVEGGERGVIERAAMRHYLAIEAYLGSSDLQTRLRRWYEAIARYPQLEERVGFEEYLAMKQREAAG
jgi:hypothetical protein